MNKYGERLSLGAKERVLELIEDKNMKILCKKYQAQPCLTKPKPCHQ